MTTPETRDKRKTKQIRRIFQIFLFRGRHSF
jgi:hypothetical protein